MKETLHKNPYHGTNNRKRTLGRIRMIERTQSIPVWEKDKYGNPTKFLGFKYIEH